MDAIGYRREQLLNRLRFDNPWWTRNKIDEVVASLPRRAYLEHFYSLVRDEDVRRGIILMGPRRVGKTVMIFHAVQRLIDDGVNPRKIIYVSVDTPIFNRASLEELFALARESLGTPEETNGFYVFFDEIQYLREWEIHLKSLIDSYRGTKFAASGSAAAALKLKSNESGAGRFSDFQLPPLTFCEYLKMKSLDHLCVPAHLNWNGEKREYLSAFDVPALNGHFLDYLNFGGYPEVVFSEKIQADPGRFVRGDIIDKVLLRDLPSLYGIADVQELNAFFSVIAYHSGCEFSYESMARASGVRKETLKKYMEYLEAAFLIKIVHRVDANARRFQRQTSFKIFLTNPSLRCALFQPLTAGDDMPGNLVETAVFAQMFPRENAPVFYANWRAGRTQSEVDMVGLSRATQTVEWASEIKWSNKFVEKPTELKSLVRFAEISGLKDCIVTSIDKTRDVALKNGCVLHFIPASVYALAISANTLGGRRPGCGL